MIGEPHERNEPVDLNHGDLAITSSAFENGGPIPARFAGDEDNVSPPLEISGVPGAAQTLALVVHDPDAPLTRGFTHWVAYGIPAETTEIPEGGGDAFTQGPNSAGEQSWMGMAPPPGHGPHNYYFHLYALDTDITQTGLDREGLLTAIDGHVVEQARLVGVYEL